MMMSFDAEYEQYDNNPFKRRCKKCGATQHRFTDGWNEWWEEMSSGDNRDCGCHHHVKQQNFYKNILENGCKNVTQDYES